MLATPRPSTVDWTLLALTVALAATGLWTAVAAVPGAWWVFAAHGVLSVLFAIFLAWKLVRVADRLRPHRWDRGTVTSVAVGGLAVGALATGVAWTWGAPIWVRRIAVVTVHAGLGLLVLPALAVHLRYRYRRLDLTVADRRRAVLHGVGVTAVAALTWGAQRVLARTVGPVVRFTGSRERGRFTGNAFPRTEWAADDPDPVDADTWRLTVDGEVDTPLTLEAEPLATGPASETAVLDCTSGWYTVQDWRGYRLGELLEAADVRATGRYVSVVSVTGYRWTFTRATAADLLLATHVGDDRLSHAHGFPLRLVAPGHRGYRWVKWVTHIEVRSRADPGKWVAIFTSGFD